MRRLSIPAGHMMAPREMLGTAAHHGLSLRPQTSITWNTETFAQNQNANAIRWGTLYNFRFDADQPPQTANATVGFFKTGSPMMVAIQAPAGGTPTPTPTATATADAPRQRRRLRQRHTPTATPRPTPTPRSNLSPRPRPNASAAPLVRTRRRARARSEVLQKSFLLLSRARERNYHFISARLTLTRRIHNNVKDNPYRLRAAVSSVFRKQLGELRSATQAKRFRRDPPARFRK